MKRPVPKFVASKDGTKIAYEVDGHGQAVVLVLGALNTRRSGAKLAKLLAPRFAVVGYDRRGRGDSTDTLPYSPRREVEDLEALTAAVGGPVCLYGHSSGGALAIKAAAELRNQVKRLAVYEPPYAPDVHARKAARAYDKALKGLLKAGRNGDAVALFVKAVGVSDKQIQAMRRLPMWRGLERLAPTLAYESELLGAGHSPPTPLLSRIKTPTLVIHGGAGAASMRDAARAVTQAMPKARLRTLAGQTHGVKPEVLAPILEEFFS